MRIMRKNKNIVQIISFVMVLLFICIGFIGCSFNDGIEIDEYVTTVPIGKNFRFSKSINTINVYYESTNPTVFSIDDYNATALEEGEAIIRAYSENDVLIKSYLIKVVPDVPSSIAITGEKELYVGNTLKLTATVSPSDFDSSVDWESTDETIATVKNGYVIGVNPGLVTIKAISKVDEKVFGEIEIWVFVDESKNIIITQSKEEENEKLNISNMQGVLKPVIEKNINSIVGINSYYLLFGRITYNEEASGLVYKRYFVLDDGTEILDNGVNEVLEFNTYKYYVVTNKHLVQNKSSVEVYYDGKKYKATVIAYDSKVNIAVLTFNSNTYFQTATFGDSDDVKTGELVIAIGNTSGNEYPRSSSLGIISYDNRYLADDTDGDGVSDWDALYIQYDASVSDGSSGGALVNLNGEVIGLNTLRINSTKVENMAFAIPSNLVLDLIESLEKGVVPNRPVLNISGTEVKTILADSTLQSTYNVPESINYGFYVSEVNNPGVGYTAGIKVNDIILEIDDQIINYSYELRIMINEHIVGAGDEMIIKVYRDGKIVTLKAVF